jgi:NAD(P)-dependent dehydrogenase (short-subunit alcohol dehydrogenase family)
MAATIGISGLAAYGASKAAVESFTKAWTAEYAAQGVRVNTVALGPAGTPARAAMGETFEVLASSTPAGHGATPDEIAATVSFLARDDASFVLWSDPARARRARRRLTRAGRTRESLKFLAQLVDAIDAGSRVRTAVERVR